jgi:integrase/recombinase XerD
MSVVRQCLEDYLAARRALGFKVERQECLLTAFVRFLESTGATAVTTELAVSWATDTKESVNWRADRLDAARQFARYLQAIDPNTEVPPAGLLPRASRRATPHIYTDTEVAALLEATRTLRTRIARATYPTLISLLFVTGMRPGEAIRLDRTDINWEHGLLTVRDTKFGKFREVALHATTVAALASYSRQRDALIPHPSSPSFFVSQVGTRLIHNDVDRTYRSLVRAAALDGTPSRRLRLHDFRHTFAVRTVLDWYRAGLDVGPRLPLLSTYLGHVDPISTYWYLSATPELLSLAAQRLQRTLEGGDPS